MPEKDHYWMTQALALATTSACEVPVAAIVVKDNQLISQAHNETLARQDPTAHAEILAIQRAALKLANYRLHECTLYTTLEPCCMCAGAIVHARIKRVVYACMDWRVGAAGSVFNILGDPRQYFHPQVEGGVLKQQASDLLEGFFRSRRGSKRIQQASLCAHR